MCPGMCPAMTASRRSPPRTVRAMGPFVDSPNRSGTTGPCETRPRVGLIPKSPHALLGMRIDPPPSLPCATGASPAATAAAAPPLEPPADRDRSHGVRRSEEHTSELQSRENLVCRLLLEKKKQHLGQPH